MNRSHKFVFSTAVVVLFCSFLLNLFMLNLTSEKAYAGKILISFDELNLVKEALNLIRNHYVDGAKVEKENLLYGAIDGMIAKLEDPYSRFMPPKNYNDMKEDTRGSFGGLGMMLGEKNKRLAVISPIVETPAYRAGIQAGDYIVKVDDKDVSGMSVEDVVKILRGMPGTKVKISIFRDGMKHLLDYNLVREEIKVPALKAQMIDEEIGYASLSSFTQRAPDEIDAALEKFEKRGMKAFILDLRHNPGGLLEAAVNIGRLFLTGTRIVTIKARTGEETPYSAYTAKYRRFPLIVLIDSGSASASEIVAGAVKDTKRGILLGQKSFGKGSVQTVMQLSDGSAMAITTAYYYTPGGTCIHKIGIEPDIKVELPKLDDAQAKEFRDERSKFMNDSVSGASDASKAQFMKVSKYDTQLMRAIDILKSSVVFNDKLLQQKGAAASAGPAPTTPAR